MLSEVGTGSAGSRRHRRTRQPLGSEYNGWLYGSLVCGSAILADIRPRRPSRIPCAEGAI